MKEIDIINLVKEWSYRTDYNNGQIGYELSEQELKHIAKTIVKKFTICGVVSTSCDLTDTELKNKVRLADIDYHLRKERS